MGWRLSGKQLTHYFPNHVMPASPREEAARPTPRGLGVCTHTEHRQADRLGSTHSPKHMHT